MEAVIAASYIGSKDALDGALPVLDKPMGDHLRYAVRTSLGSETLIKHWKGTDSPQINAFVTEFDAKNKRGPREKKKTGEETAFDKQPEVA